LPTTSRDLTFQLTVRDNRADGGGINADILNLRTVASAGPFQVTSPNTAVNWTGNANATVNWGVANTDNAPVNCDNVNILLSTDGGNTFPTTLLSQTPNDGSQSVNVPNMATANARVKVECVFVGAASTKLSFFDMSNVDFTITSGSASGQLDVDDDGNEDALTDGLLIIRYLFSFTGDILIKDAIAPGATRTTANAVETYLNQRRALFDVDGDGREDALTDGVLVIRYLFGFTGDTLINGAVRQRPKITFTNFLLYFTLYSPQLYFLEGVSYSSIRHEI